jgi:hypothetical protein
MTCQVQTTGYVTSLSAVGSVAESVQVLRVAWSLVLEHEGEEKKGASRLNSPVDLTDVTMLGVDKLECNRHISG